MAHFPLSSIFSGLVVCVQPKSISFVWKSSPKRLVNIWCQLEWLALFSQSKKCSCMLQGDGAWKGPHVSLTTPALSPFKENTSNSDLRQSLLLSDRLLVCTLWTKCTSFPVSCLSSALAQSCFMVEKKVWYICAVVVTPVYMYRVAWKQYSDVALAGSVLQLYCCQSMCSMSTVVISRVTI